MIFAISGWLDSEKESGGYVDSLLNRVLAKPQAAQEKKIVENIKEMLLVVSILNLHNAKYYLLPIA